MRTVSVIWRACAVAAVAAAPLALSADHFNGGRTVPVHRLAPLDAEGDKISPSSSLPEPISQAKTCTQCHDTHLMSGGSHFRTGLDTNDAPESVAVEPWFWADEKTGTAIPLTLHGQPGAFRPAEFGLSCWQWTKMFGRNFPGGGVGSDPRAVGEVAGERQRWFVTGPLGPNCLACHQQRGYDSSEWARQVLRENFAGAATAASGIGAVEGMNERLESSWDGLRAENPDDHLFKVPEKTVYGLRRFDAKNRCVFDVGRPKNENCLACHSVSQKGMPSHAIAGDVHLQRGMNCVDCHKNGIDHRVKTTSCRDCHVSPKGAGPRPTHEGIPLVHFEKLACTVCHSGVTEKGARSLVRTSRANRIGIYGRAQWATDAPYIVEPVFVRNKKGVVEPRRMMWPSGFYRVGADNALKPIPPAEAEALAGDALTVVARVDAALGILRETEADVNLGKIKLRPDGSLCYASKTNEAPLIATEDRAKDEFKNLLITLCNARRSERVAACRDGKVYTIDDQGNVNVCDDVKAPSADEWPVGTLAADGKAFLPLIDRWTLDQYQKVKDSDQPFTRDIVARALNKAGADVRYVSAGLVFSLDKDGNLVETAGAQEAQPVSWPVGHDVRPARQARGASPAKCADCHTSDSEFFFGKVVPTGPIVDANVEPVQQTEFLGLSPTYHAVLGTTFAMRPLFKFFLWSVFGFLCLFACAAAAVVLNRLGAKISEGTLSFAWGFTKWIVDMGFVVSLIYLALSGAIGWLRGGMTGWWLVLHMVAGGCLAGCTALLALFRAADRTKKFGQGILWLLWLVCAVGTVFTAVMPMMTVYGELGQEVLLWSHRLSAFAFAGVSLLVCWSCCRRRRA